MNTPNAGRLLILDDDPDVAQTIAMVAESEGLAARTTSLAAEFFQLVTDWAPTHLAVDLVMPGMDGVEVLRQLAERGCDAGIVVTSGMGTKVLESAQRSAHERGLHIVGIMPKPFKVSALRSLLKEARPRPRRSDPGIDPSPKQHLSASDISDGFLNHEFLLHYQPKVALKDASPVGFEALVRWQHARHGLIPPDRFIPQLEKSGDIHQLTDHVFRLATDWFARVPRYDSLSLSVNLSAANLDDLGLADRLNAICTAAGVSPASIILELTETSAMANPADAYDILARLRIKGFRMGIDDFGTGYSSMVQLARLPFSELKIDKSFVLSMGHSEESRKIVQSTIQLSRSLGLTAVAEGVEDVQTADMLRAIGGDFGQGYLYSRPMEGVKALDWLEGIR